MLLQPLVSIRAVRPDLGTFPRAIIEAILLTEGPIGSAEQVAHELGLRNRFQLARLLQRERLPPLHVMSEWALLLSWVVTAERDNVSLCWMAFHAGRHPSTCYRLVKELTGLCWEQVRGLGSSWVQQRFLDQFGETARRMHASSLPRSMRASLPRYAKG